MEEFTTIKELETPIKLTRFLYFYDLLFILGYTFITYELFANHVLGRFQRLYLINCVLWGIYLIFPAFGNPKRQNWKHILNTLLNMNTGRTYYGVKGEVDEYETR